MPRKKIPNEVIPQTYQMAKSHYEGRVALSMAIAKLKENCLLNEGSARDYIYAFWHMRNGDVFHRTLNSASLNYYLKQISVDYGEEGLVKALSALRLHISYYESKSKGVARYMRKALSNYDWILKEMAYHQEEVDDMSDFPEGRIIERIHRFRERRGKAVESAKRKFMSIHKKLFCEVCGFNFEEKYSRGQGFIEAHHVLPVKEMPEGHMTKIEDFVMLCSNCHKMVHRYRPWLERNNLKSILKVSL